MSTFATSFSIENNPLIEAAKVYTPDKIKLLTQGFEKLSSLDDLHSDQAQRELKPFQEIFTLIPELIDKFAQDLSTLTSFGLRIRLRLKEAPDIDSLLKSFEVIGKNITGIGQKAVKHSLSDLAEILHSDNPQSGGQAHMKRKTLLPKNPQNIGKSFDLDFKNSRYVAFPNARSQEAYKKRITKALARVQKTLDPSTANQRNQDLEGALDSDTPVNCASSKAMMIMKDFFQPLFKTAHYTLERMLDIGIKLQQELPDQFKNILNTKIEELFQYGETRLQIKPNSLRELGTLSYKLTAPVEDLKNEAARES